MSSSVRAITYSGTVARRDGLCGKIRRSGDNEGGAFRASFKPDKYYIKAVSWTAETSVTTGTGVTTFSPNSTCTRAQVVAFLRRANGCLEFTSTVNPFKVVPDGQYYTKAVLWAVEKSITKGTSVDRFSPASTCTRGQIVTFLYRDMK